MFEKKSKHPIDEYLRQDRIPHIWCPGCGIGTAMHAFVRALKKLNFDRKDIVVVSGIGCTGRVAGYIKLDSFHTTHGRAIPFATGLKLANEKLHVIVFSGDGDLVAIGGNHFIHAARRNIDITVICVNNFNYGMTGGQCGPTTPITARSSTTPFGNYELPFNLPYLAAGSGAVFVSRWTVLHVKRLENAIYNAINKNGFSFIEALSPCPTLYGRMNRLGSGLKIMEHYKKKSIINHKADLREIDLRVNNDIILGDFVDLYRPTFSELVEANIASEQAPTTDNKNYFRELRKKIEARGHY